MFKKIVIKTSLILSPEDVDYLEKLYDELDGDLLWVIEEFREGKDSDFLKTELK